MFELGSERVPRDIQKRKLGISRRTLFLEAYSASVRVVSGSSALILVSNVRDQRGRSGAP